MTNYIGQRTKCCEADFKVVNGKEGTSYYKCDKCLNACDVMSRYKDSQVTKK